MATWSQLGLHSKPVAVLDIGSNAFRDPKVLWYAPQHKWVMAVDANRCIGCGLCAEACKTENHVPEGSFYRTWIERYHVRK